ncbi:MAG: hemolysin family protein [Candidatus Rhabdochlamydia sp.]
MNPSWQFLVFLIVICVITQGFFAMVEMACVSFNKVRLQYYVSKGMKRAIWLSDLLQHPGRLFGSALICINASLLIGSEASRRLYEAFHLDPDFAPLTQVIIVIIFAEIAPLFAGRRYAEHAAMIGVPVLYGISFLLKPLITFFDLFCRMIQALIGSSDKGGFSLSREELQKILEEKDGEDFNTTAAKIFALRTMTAKELMQPLNQITLLPATATLLDLRILLKQLYFPFIPLFHKHPANILSIVYPRDLLRLPNHKKVRDFAKAPWFITTKDPILSILKQFRHNNQSLAVVLDEKGQAVGILTLDEIIDEIFGLDDSWMSFEEIVPRAHHVVVDRSFPSHQSIEEFNHTYHLNLDGQGKKTLEELMIHTLGHIPTLGETVKIDQFELIVEEVTLLGIKTIGVSTLY